MEQEITESTIMKDLQSVMSTLKTSKNTGVMLSVDDFGTGYFLLNYLKKFPIDALKIDAGFVRDVQTDPNDRAIIKSIIALARNMGLKIIAEGVESPAQLEILATMGCDYIQSYFVGHPMSASDCEQQFLIKSKR